MGVKAGGEHHEVGLEIISGGNQNLFKELAIHVISFTRSHRHIYGRTFTRPFTFFGRTSCSRIVRILVSTKKKDGRVVIKGMLRPIPMMHVPIDNQHARDSMLSLEVSGSNGHVVEKTKSHGSIVLGMVSRRTYGAKSVVYRSRDDRVCGGE